MTITTGGPAFPRPAGDYSGTRHGNTAQEGMTLRDYFAARAMQGALGNMRGQFGRDHADANMNLAVASYAIADAMLTARKSAAKQADHICPGCGVKGWTGNCDKCIPY
jgi:hypothetical protein